MGRDLKPDFMESVFALKKMKAIFPKNVGLSHFESMVLNHIFFLSDGEKEVTVSDIQFYLEVTKPAISQSLNSLENKGYITRQIGAIDRRSIALSVTSKGREILDECKKQIDRNLDDLIAQFGEEDFRTLLSLLKKLSITVEQIKIQEKG